MTFNPRANRAANLYATVKSLIDNDPIMINILRNITLRGSLNQRYFNNLNIDVKNKFMRILHIFDEILTSYNYYLWIDEPDFRNMYDIWIEQTNGTNILKFLKIYYNMNA